MLDTKLCGNRPAGSGEEDFEGFIPFMGMQPSWSCDQHHINKLIFMYLKAYIQTLVKNALVVSVKSMF